MEMDNEVIGPAKEQDHFENVEKPKKVIKATFAFVIFIFVGLFFLGLGYYLGVGGEDNIKQRMVGKDAPVRYQDIDFSRFWESLGVLEDKFIGTIDYEKAIDGAIAGMTASAGDPFTAYFNKDTLAQFDGEINGTFEGIGAEISIRNNRLTIIAPLAGSPAEKAGLRAGDMINAIDGESVVSMSVDEAIMKIRGKNGTAVTLNIARDGETGSIDLKVNREVINVKSLDYKINDDGTAYIRILRFDQNTGQLLDAAADQIKAKKAKGIVLDLRNDPGGYLESSIDVASQFIKEGVIVYEEYKGGAKEGLNATGKGKLFDIPMVVLINGGSASASEIVAGAIHDHNRGSLIGEKTFGKGSVQELQPLKEGGALKVTIAKWLTPNGTAIDKSGLLPDIEVKWAEDKDIKKDNQLDRGYEELNKIIK